MKKGVKKMPNHEKVNVPVKVLKSEEGENRAFKRQRLAEERNILKRK